MWVRSKRNAFENFDSRLTIVQFYPKRTEIYFPYGHSCLYPISYRVLEPFIKAVLYKHNLMPDDEKLFVLLIEIETDNSLFIDYKLCGIALTLKFSATGFFFVVLSFRSISSINLKLCSRRYLTASSVGFAEFSIVWINKNTTSCRFIPIH